MIDIIQLKWDKRKEGRHVCSKDEPIGTSVKVRFRLTGLGKRVVPRLRESRFLRGASSRNLGTTLLPSPVQYHLRRLLQ